MGTRLAYRKSPEQESPEEETNSLFAEIKQAKATPQEEPLYPAPLMEFPDGQAGGDQQYHGMDRQDQPSISDRWDSMDTGDKRSLLRGATPLLVGLLSGGDMGDAYAIAGKGLIEEDKILRDEQSQTMAAWLKAKREGSKSSDIQSKQFKSGELGHFDKSTQKYYDSQGNVIEDPQGYQGITLDKFGKKIRVKDTAQYKGDMAVPPNWTKAKDAKIEKMLPRYTKKAEEAEESYLDLEGALQDIGKGEFRSKLAVMKLVKQVETRLSDADREFYLSRYGMWQKVKHMIDRTTTDDLPDTVLQQASEMIQQALSRKQIAMDHISKRYVRQLSASGIPEDYARSRLGIQNVAKAKGKTKLSPEDAEAVQWAKDNPEHPSSKAILEVNNAL